MTKPILFLPRGSYDPDKYAAVVPDPTEHRDDISVINHVSLHREKALALVANVAGQTVIVAGGGEEWTEDLKDKVERMREEEAALASEREQHRKEGEARFRQALGEQLDKRLTAHRRSPRTNPDPKFVIPREKRFW